MGITHWVRGRCYQAGHANIGQGPANRAIDGGPMGLDLATAVQGAVLTAFFDAACQRDGAFHRFDNIGQIDRRSGSGEADAAAAAARGDQQARAGQLADQFLHGGAGDMRLFRQFGRL